jgi:hypothetical protein
MSLFDRLSKVTVTSFERTFCGESCETCHDSDPGCTMSSGHNKTQGHFSNKGDGGCGHRWGKG